MFENMISIIFVIISLRKLMPCFPQKKKKNKKKKKIKENNKKKKENITV